MRLCLLRNDISMGWFLVSPDIEKTNKRSSQNETSVKQGKMKKIRFFTLKYLHKYKIIWQSNYGSNNK
jgi:hypothetical protein